MNKYLKGVLNCIIELAIGFVGLLFSLNILIAGFIFFPPIVILVDQVMLSNPVWWKDFVPGALPIFFIFTALSFSILSMFLTLKLINKFAIEKIIKAVREDLKGGWNKKQGGKLNE